MKGQREREKWWAVRKRGHGCHAPRVKPAINREVKLLRHSLVHRSLPFARKSLHLSLSRETTVPCPWKYISIYICSSFLLFFFLSLPSPSKFSLHEFTTRFREKARRRRNANRSRIEFHRGGIRDPGSALTTSPSKSDKARSRSRAPQLFRSRGARPSWKRKVEKGRRRRRGERVHNVIRSLFIDSRQCTRIR